MLHVFLDTSALVEANFGSAFKRLVDLVDEKVVIVHLSQIVVEEWASIVRGDLKRRLRESLAKLEGFRRNRSALYFELSERTHEAHSQLNALKEKLSEINGQRLASLLQAEILTIDDSHGRMVFDSYFQGDRPFAQAKNRNDIPDAFIYLAARDLQNNINEPLHAVARDKKLREALSTISPTVYERISDLVSSSLVLAEIATNRQAIWQQIKETVIAFFRSNSASIMDAFSDPTDIVGSRTISHEMIPSDDNEAWIAGVYDSENITLDWDNVEDFGEGSIQLPFSFDCGADLEFPIHTDQALGVSEDHVWVLWQDAPFHEGGGSVTLHVEGDLAVEFDLEWITAEDLEDVENIVDDLQPEVSVENIESIEIEWSDDYGIFHSRTMPDEGSEQDDQS